MLEALARDLHAGPAGTIGGITSSDSLKLRVTSAAGPFVVMAPNTALTWAGGSPQTVTWNSCASFCFWRLRSIAYLLLSSPHSFQRAFCAPASRSLMRFSWFTSEAPGS